MSALDSPRSSPRTPATSTAQVRAWARANGVEVPEGGRLRPQVHQAWREAHQ